MLKKVIMSVSPYGESWFVKSYARNSLRVIDDSYSYMTYLGKEGCLCDLKCFLKGEELKQC